MSISFLKLIDLSVCVCVWMTYMEWHKVEKNNEEKTNEVIDLEDFKEASFKVAYIKDGVATKVRRDGPQKELTLVTLGHGLMIM